MIHSPFYAILWIASVCQKKKKNINRKRKTRKNADRRQTKPNAFNVRYNVKILQQ